MADSVTKKKRSEIMSRVRDRDSKIEISFRKELWKQGFRYRKNSREYLGKPDIILPRYNVTIFIDSCFWHGCRQHCRIPATHKSYWVKKLKKNILRDEKVTAYYKKLNWKVFRFWEHQIDNRKKILKKIASLSSSLP